MVAERPPKGVKGPQPKEIRRAAETETPRQPHGPGSLSGEERVLKAFKDALGLGVKGAIPGGFGLAGKGADGVGGPVPVGMEIKGRVIWPDVMGQGLQRPQGHGGVEIRAGVREKFVKHPAKGEHRRAGVNGLSAHHDLAHLAAAGGRALHHGDGVSVPGKIDRATETANPRADHNDPLQTQIRTFIVRCARRYHVSNFPDSQAVTREFPRRQDRHLGYAPMTVALRIEAAIEAVLARAECGHAPPRLAAAVRHAVFSGGARIRPQLCLAVAKACGGDNIPLAEAAAVAVELLHCASLVHDDLPCFDDAATRRGKPSVHMAFGEPLAVLAGDAMIVMAFSALAQAGAQAPTRLAPLLTTVCRGVGMPGGIVAGQAWESEPFTPVELYHQSKTGALFVAATMSGAVASGGDPHPWRRLGETLGGAYQVADDLLDAVSGEAEAGKPTGRDAALQRPSLVAELGIKGAYARLGALVEEAVAAIPDCDGAKDLRDLVAMQATRLAPKQLARNAA